MKQIDKLSNQLVNAFLKNKIIQSKINDSTKSKLFFVILLLLFVEDFACTF